MLQNADLDVVNGFGDEWSRFDQSSLSQDESNQQFASYFSIFPFDALPAGAEGFDAGCGSGRWARHVAQRVGVLHAIDASEEALAVARRNLSSHSNVKFLHASVANIPLPDGSQDFGYCLGVLHHMPDTKAGLEACARKLKSGAPFLVYLYYRFENRPTWFRLIWSASDVLRRRVSRLPHGARYATSQFVAGFVYWPLARVARLTERLGAPPAALPLSYYRDKSFYTMRTDALDRFGTRLEQRFTRQEIVAMFEAAGLENVRFSESEPYWCAIGFRRP